MRDLLPDFVRETIRDRYLAGVADAEAGFEYGEADEDSLTGALGQAISTKDWVTSSVDGQNYHWRIYYRKIRGRGAGAPEKHYGTDGIFQIEVADASGQLLRRKGLPFQAKKGWSSLDRSLASQAGKMLDMAGDGIVIDYTDHGYTACSASSVILAHGQRTEAIKAGAVQPLGQALANEFLNCEIGKKGLFFNPDDESFQQLETPPTHLITTSIVRAPS
jgi:hypothetical protein